MTKETLDRANEITNKIKELEKNLSALKYKVSERKKDIEIHKGNVRKWIPCSKWFCKGTVEQDGKVKLDAPRERHYPLDFELDEECVEFIIKHEEEKIAKLKKELEEL
jgi:hypothetical protein